MKRGGSPVFDMAGKRYGRLVGLRLSDRRGPLGQLYWWFQCDCGKEHEARGALVRTGHATSCGCYRKERVDAGLNFRHGSCHSKLHMVWCAMKQRCYNQRHKDFKHYGARGITVCQSWRDSFAAFLADVGERPEGLTLDRINNDGNYEPGNTRWATQSQQNKNSRRWQRKVA